MNRGVRRPLSASALACVRNHFPAITTVMRVLQMDLFRSTSHAPCTIRLLEPDGYNGDLFRCPVHAFHFT